MDNSNFEAMELQLPLIKHNTALLRIKAVNKLQKNKNKLINRILNGNYRRLRKNDSPLDTISFYLYSP
jgi:hypothetical protein